MSASEQLLRNNEGYAGAFRHSGLTAPPRLKLAIVTCMDARIDPAAALGLEEGDAHVIRNAGGVVTDDVIRSLSVSQHHLGTEAVLVIQHTQCGMMTFTDEDFASQLEHETGLRPEWASRTFADLEQSVRDGVRRIEDDPFVPRKDQIKGFVYEVETGRVREVS